MYKEMNKGRVGVTSPRFRDVVGKNREGANAGYFTNPQKVKVKSSVISVPSLRLSLVDKLASEGNGQGEQEVPTNVSKFQD